MEQPPMAQTMSGSNTATVIVNPTGDATLEPDETVTLTITSGTGYDIGSPSSATGTITNDDTGTSLPKVALVGINQADAGVNPTHQDGFSFVALEDITSGTVVHFTRRIYDKNTIAFGNTFTGTVKWTASVGVNRGDVYTVMETSADVFTVTCSDGSSCGTATNIDAGFTIPTSGITLYAYTDNNDNPTDGVTEIYSALHTGDLVGSVNGGAIPAISNPSTIYPSAVVVDNFPNTNPGRTEYKFPTERQVTVTRTLLTNVSNWLHAQSTATAPSTVRFTNIIVTSGVPNPLVTVTASPSSVLENSGTGMVYTFTLSQTAASNMTINFGLSGTATFTTDYTQTGATSFTASTGSFVIPSGSNTASVTITPVADATLEPNETVVLSVDVGTGYDAGNPSVATGTITNDDIINVNPLVVIVGVNHGTNPDPDGISFAANQNLTAGTEIYFTDSPYNNTTLNFSAIESVTKYTVPTGGLAKGQVVYVVETGQLTNAFTVTCSAGSNCGTFAFISGDFAISSNGEDFYAYTDTDGDPTNGITAIHSLFYTINGAIPTAANPNSVFPNAVVVSGFGSSLPNRTEYKFATSERSIPINLANIQITGNYLIAQTTQGLSVIPFAALNLCPASITTNPSNPAAFCAGSNTSVSVTATGSGLTYQWQVNSGAGFSNIANGGIYSGATSATLTLTNVPFANNGFTYQCVVNACATSTAATLTVNALPTASPGSNTPVCVGSNLNLTSTVATSYLWSGPNTFTSSQQNPVIIAVTSAVGGTYTLRVTNASSCTATATVAVTVNTVPTATASSNSPVCAGNSISLTGRGVGTYLWTGPNAYSSTAQNPTITSATVSATGTYTITVTGAGNCTSTATTAVLVNGITTASVTPSTQTICNGGAITTIAITGNGTSYTWTRDNTGSVTGIAASGSGDISGSLTNTTEAPITVTFTITPVSICNGTSVTATVVVNPIPTVTTSTPSQSICSGANITGITFNNPAPLASLAPDPSSDITPVASKETTGIGLSSFVSGTVFNWTRDNTATVIGIPASGMGNISGILTNTTASPVTVTFTVTPSFTNAGTTCTGTPITVTVTVNPNPPTPTITDAGTAFCSGSSTTLTSSADPSYTSYAWERSLTGIANPNSFTAFGGTAQTQVVTTSGVYRVVVGNQYNCFARDTIAVKFGDFVFSGSLGAGDAQQTGRMFRDGNASTCASPKAYPGIFTTSGSIFYDSYTVNNPTSAPVCATIGLTSGCVTSLYSAAYLGSFNPTSLGTNYLADHGSSFPNTAFYEATIPANGTIVVVVHEVNPGTGCSNYNLRVDVPGATVAQTASSNSPICAGNTLNLTGIGTGTYAWSGPNSFTSTDQNPSIANATTLATGTYTISVTNTNGCVFNATTAVTVNANPTATASSSTPVICAGNTISLTGGGVGTYQWAGPNTFSSTAQSPIIVNATTLSTGTYTITVTNSTNCSSTATVAVIVNAIPTATASSSMPVVCAGNNISLTGGGIGMYAWAGPNGYSSTAQSPTISNATISATGTYTITVTNTSSCTSTATVAVTVNAVPTATASNNSPVCAGNSVALTGGGIGTYLWTGPSGYSSTAQSPTIANATILSSGVYRITVTNANNCTSTATTSVTVNPLPVVDTGANQTICEGSTASLTATCNLLTFNTTLSGASEVPANASTATGNVSGTYDKVTKQLLLTFTFNGLTANASAAHLHKGAVGVNGPVQIGFSGVPSATSGSFTYIGTLTTTQETDLLAGLYYANIHNASFPGGEIRGQLSTACVANNFVWNPGNLSGQTVTVSPSAAQLYTITATNTATGCSTTATTTVNVDPRPVPTIGSNTPVCAGNTLNLNAGGGTSYAWSGPNTFTATDTNPSIASVTLLATGTYTVTVTNVNGCTNTATTAVVINSLPTATASNNSPICSGTTLNLTGGGVGSYLWSGPNTFTSTAQSPSILLSTTSISGTYTILVTNVNGCTSTATTSVNVNPVVTIPTPQANTQIIFGASITLTATGCSGVNDVLKWYQTSDNALAVIPVSPTATTNYYAKCETTLNGITCISGNSTDITVTVLSPNPPVATGATNCLGTATTLTATGCSGAVGTFVLKWYQNADNVLVTMPVSPLVSTDYYAKCEQTFNSVTAVSAKSNVVTLTILNPPTPVATGGIIYSGQSITLTSTGCTGTLGTFTLRWYQTSDNGSVTMPVSPTVTTQYYTKCEQTANTITCLSAKSNDVTLTVVNRIFVDITKIAAPIQNGNSWATAYGNLQTGLAAATTGVEVWVAKGTYKPTNTSDRTVSFNIPNDVLVYGGFLGTEDNLIDRNFRTNISILSGDIGGQKLASDNSYHVVVMNGLSSSTVLDGFTISDGYANFDPNRTFFAPNTLAPTTTTIETGGGIVVKNAGSPMIVNCTVTNNAAVTGGGIYAGDASKPTIRFCKFMGNQAGFGSGLYFQDGSHGKIDNTLIAGNKGIGGIYNNNSNPMFTNTTLAGNGGYNGGIFNASSQPIVKNSIIWGNTLPFNDTQSIITYSTIQGGYAGVGNLSMDPKFVNLTPDGLSPNITGDYHLQASSLAIDRGDNGAITLTDKDLDDNLRRFSGGRVDMGAYEFQATSTATLVISVATGNWESNSTWDIGRIPQLGDYVIIDNSHVITLNTTGVVKNLEYRGTGQLKLNTTTSKLEIGF